MLKIPTKMLMRIKRSRRSAVPCWAAWPATRTNPTTEMGRLASVPVTAPWPPSWLGEAQTEFAYLLAQVDRRRLEARLAELLPTVDTAFFDACARSLRPGASPWPRVWLRLSLHRRLRPYAYRPPFALLARRVGRRLGLLPRARGLRLAHGGTVVALLGGDGAGKSTCVAELSRWLGPQFDVTTAHLGRPPRSLTTLVIGGLLKVRRALGRALNGGADERGTGGPGLLELLRLVCTARDRYRLSWGPRSRGCLGTGATRHWRAACCAPNSGTTARSRSPTRSSC